MTTTIITWAGEGEAESGVAPISKIPSFQKQMKRCASEQGKV